MPLAYEWVDDVVIRVALHLQNLQEYEILVKGYMSYWFYAPSLNDLQREARPWKLKDNEDIFVLLTTIILTRSTPPKIPTRDVHWKTFSPRNYMHTMYSEWHFHRGINLHVMDDIFIKELSTHDVQWMTFSSRNYIQWFTTSDILVKVLYTYEEQWMTF